MINFNELDNFASRHNFYLHTYFACFFSSFISIKD